MSIKVYLGVLCLALVLDFSTASVQNDEPIFAKALRYMKENPDIVESTLTKLTKGEHEDKVKTFVYKIKQDEGCTACESAVSALKLAAIIGWEGIRNVTFALCLDIFNNTGGEVMCPVVDLQGPHIFDIVSDDGTSATDICETLNFCMPPKAIQIKTKKPNQLQEKKTQHNRPSYRKHPRKRSAQTLSQTLKIVQLTDIHVDQHYAEGSNTNCGAYVCCRESYKGSGSAGPYGDYNCNIPMKTLNLFLEQISQMNPDFIIFSGDTPPHHMWTETFESQLNCTATLIEAIKKTLGNHTIYPNIGNHEMYPTNLYYLGLNATKQMNNEFAEWWQPFANFTNDQVTTMRTAGYYQILAREGLRILSINTNYWYNMNFYNVWNKDSDELKSMHNFINQTLTAARANEEKVLIIGHHPLGGGDSLVRPARWFKELMLEFGDIVVLHVAGHTHRDELRLFHNNEGEAKHVIHVSPSGSSGGTVNPSMRMYHLNATSFKLEEVEQYYMNLSAHVYSATNDFTVPTIELSYKAKAEYNMTELTPQAYADLAKRMETNTELFERYHRNLKAKAPLTSACDQDCRKDYLCKIRNSVYDEYQECADLIGQTTTTNPPTTTTNDNTSCGPFCIANTQLMMIISILLVAIQLM